MVLERGQRLKETYWRSCPKATSLKFLAVRCDARGTDGVDLPFPPEAATM